jgi:hypothetical protein
MSIKQYFETQNMKFFNKELQEVSGRDFESFDYLEEVAENREKFIPNIDFSDPANFARYGSAEEYYNQSIIRIKDLYPYDGSRSEKLDFKNKSTYLDSYIFDHLYPRTNGHIILSAEGWGTNTAGTSEAGANYGIPDTPEYIFIKGGPNSGPLNTYDGGNVYNTASYRGTNLALDLSTSGFCTEFWLKKSGSISSALTKNEVITEYWNNDATTTSKGLVRLSLFDWSTSVSSSYALRLDVHSGSASTFFRLGNNNLRNQIKEGSWNHIAVSYNNQTASLYVNGDLQSSDSRSTTLGDIKGTINATIGGALSGSAGAGKLSGSLDEFRHWKTSRNGEEIKRNYFKQVYGGTNTDDANTKLGVYYKFNEGITGVNATDSIVLDYSGRISNGEWTGYNTSARATTSAMVESSASAREFKDPILYDYHPDYTSLLTTVESLTKKHDLTNPSSLYNSFPDYIIEQDYENGSEFKKIIQVISSYFDTLHNQIEFLNKIKNIEYLSGSSTADQEPIIFGKRLLEEKGLFVPDLFIESSVLEDLSNTDGEREYELELFKTKNLIYKNIYNNLVQIYKSKGTEKTIRNFLRCLGVDESLVRLNIYPNNFTFDLKDRRKVFNRSKKFIDFSKKENKQAVIYNFSTGSSIPGYVSASAVDVPITMECEAIFPKIDHSTGFFASSTIHSASIFGFTGINPTVTNPSIDTTEPSAANNNSGRVYAVKITATEDQLSTKFVLESDAGNLPDLQSPIFEEVYDNAKWILGVKYYTNKSISGSFNLNETSNEGIVEFSGFNSIGDQVINEFSVTGTMNSVTDYTGSKRFYVGATRTNVTGTILKETDCKIGSLRVYYDYVSNEDLKRHSFDSKTYGTEGKYKEKLNLLSDNLNSAEIDNAHNLVQNWIFDLVSSSDSNGQFDILDASSGSVASASMPAQYAGLYTLHGAKGNFFESSASDVKTIEFMNDYQLSLPEVLNSDDMVQILERDVDKFLKDQDFTEYNIMIEKSMQAAISDEMLQMFSTITDFSNLIGEYVNRYRMNYKKLDNLRQFFFEKVDNIPKVEKFIDFYKWLDTSITSVALQLLPVSSKLNLDHFTIIESHILERNKYYNKFPIIKDLNKYSTSPPTAAVTKGFESAYQWSQKRLRDQARYRDGIPWDNSQSIQDQINDPDRDSSLLNKKQLALKNRPASERSMLGDLIVVDIPKNSTI